MLSRSAPGSLAAAGLPTVAELLARGGDHRITLVEGENRYGCRPAPQPARWQLGSSTASEISAAATAALERQLARLGGGLARRPAPEVHAEEVARLRLALRGALGLDAADATVEIIFGASGTDLHLFAAALAAGPASAERPLRVVNPEAGETGTGVPAALRSRHFSDRSALGGPVALGAPLCGQAPELCEVALRDADGAPRPTAEVDADAEALVEQAARAGRPVLLVLADVSKTGLLGPSFACAAELRRRHPRLVEVLVDACQLRLAPATLRAYLGAGFLLAVTGSKFAGGPSFSGALLVPAEAAVRLGAAPLPPELGRYSARADWPASFPGAAALPEAANLGMLLRWEAALVELRAFRALAPASTDAFLGRFAREVERHLAHHAALAPITSLPLIRAGLPGPRDAASWDRHPTIFPFVVTASAAGPCSPEEATKIHRRLQRPSAAQPGIQLGQPVPLRAPGGALVGALRLCASARLCVEAAASAAAADAVIARAVAALDRAAEAGFRR